MSQNPKGKAEPLVRSRGSLFAFVFTFLLVSGIILGSALLLHSDPVSGPGGYTFLWLLCGSLIAVGIWGLIPKGVLKNIQYLKRRTELLPGPPIESRTSSRWTKSDLFAFVFTFLLMCGLFLGYALLLLLLHSDPGSHLGAYIFSGIVCGSLIAVGIWGLRKCVSISQNLKGKSAPPPEPLVQSWPSNRWTKWDLVALSVIMFGDLFMLVLGGIGLGVALVLRSDPSSSLETHIFLWLLSSFFTALGIRSLMPRSLMGSMQYLNTQYLKEKLESAPRILVQSRLDLFVLVFLFLLVFMCGIGLGVVIVLHPDPSSSLGAHIFLWVCSGSLIAVGIWGLRKCVSISQNLKRKIGPPPEPLVQSRLPYRWTKSDLFAFVFTFVFVSGITLGSALLLHSGPASGLRWYIFLWVCSGSLIAVGIWGLISKGLLKSIQNLKRRTELPAGPLIESRLFKRWTSGKTYCLIVFGVFAFIGICILLQPQYFPGLEYYFMLILCSAFSSFGIWGLSNPKV